MLPLPWVSVVLGLSPELHAYWGSIVPMSYRPNLSLTFLDVCYCMCVNLVPAFMCVHHRHAWDLQSLEESISSLELEL